MRLFVAIPVPPNIHPYCRQWQNHFEGLKKTDEFHITLQFLGDGITDTKPLMQVLEKIRFKPIEIELSHLQAFGPPHEPRGIWIECVKNTTLSGLAEKIRRLLKPLGYSEKMPFRPHITLGRYQTPPNVLPVTAKSKPLHFKINHFELVRSHLSEKGPHYETLCRFPAN